MRRLAAAILAVLAAGLGLTAVAMRLVPDDPAAWHRDPLETERTGEPNDYLVAPEGAARAAPDRVASTSPLPPAELMARFDAVALAAPRTQRIAGSPDDLWASYVQRSALFGFPDYISVRAVALPRGSALAIWSRSRFGRSDMGVNEARVEGWLGRLDTLTKAKNP